MAFVGKDIEFDGYVVGYKNLHEAAIGGTAAEMERFINAGTDINCKDEQQKTPLHQAAYFGCDRNVRNLIIGGADLEAKDWHGRTPLHLACTNHPTVHELSMMTSFFGVENKGYRRGAEALIDSGANINAQDTEGWTPLHHAAYGGSEKLVKSLLERGADPTLQGINGVTAKDVATMGMREDVKTMISERMTEIGSKTKSTTNETTR